MKNEIKQLYLKDKELAIEVAKVLGYRIKKKEIAVAPMSEKKFKELKQQAAKSLKTIPMVMKKVNKKMEDIAKRLEKGKLDDRVLDTVFALSKTKDALNGILSLILTELRF